jgi:hypothetical protein
MFPLCCSLFIAFAPFGLDRARATLQRAKQRNCKGAVVKTVKENMDGAPALSNKSVIATAKG